MCRLLIEFLMSSDNDTKLPKPKENIFAKVKLVNAKKYKKSTNYIPDCVLEKLKKHLKDLHPWEQRLFQIFSATGMRHKEVAFLEENCLSKGKYGTVLSYKLYKVLNARKQAGLSDYHSINIEESTEKLIREQMTESKKLREKENSPYIFLYQTQRRQPTLPDAGNFASKVNKLIKKYDITDEHGELWHYTTRQHRKTVVVNMIENGATVPELVYQLGHFNSGTVMNYYAEVKSMKLAELNTEFFRKQFDLLLSGENLADFSEEERKQLYVDFRLSKRKVEFGFCMRKFCEGACDSRSKSSHCVNCPNLCTGRQYLTYWEDLYQQQVEIIGEMKVIYAKEGIEDYEIFAEFILENRRLLAYEGIMNKIKESGEK